MLIHCADVVIRCDDAAIRCADAVIHCVDTVIICADTVIHCDDTVIICADTVILCADAADAGDVSSALTGSAVLSPGSIHLDDGDAAGCVSSLSGQRQPRRK